MKFVTDRKRAVGLGSGRTGTHHHWQMLISSMALVVLVPFFVFTFGVGFGGTYEEVQAYFARPFPALVTGISIVVIILHVMHETHEAIVDYVHGVPGKLAHAAVTALSYCLIASGLFALLKIAL